MTLAREGSINRALWEGQLHGKRRQIAHTAAFCTGHWEMYGQKPMPGWTEYSYGRVEGELWGDAAVEEGVGRSCCEDYVLLITSVILTIIS